MYLKELSLFQFKNHSESSFQFNEKINCFVGNNGVGKTNILELFELFNNSNVYGSISFDTAIAHICLLYNKEAIIKLRKNFKKNNIFIKKNILPSYKRKKINITYV